MSNYTAYEAGRIYMGIKLHFTTDSYDYFKYNGQIKTWTPEAFERRRDQGFFGKIARRYDSTQIETFYVSNFMDKPKAWVGELLSEECQTNYKNYLGRLEQLSYLFEQDIQRLANVCEEKGTTLDGSVKGSNPLLLKLYYQKIISPETVVILDRIFGQQMIGKIWDQNITDSVLWPKTRRFLLKYSPFVQFETTKYVRIVSKVIDNLSVQEL